ncbi:MAG TPA: FAD-binding oxidoreductase [Thermoanaerobaculia bacterium]|jgi:FAD/FMN-containing dehydrogenase|nr:FAD-binding oxidoreductase [Thermoanaerobaculia bacterium]
MLDRREFLKFASLAALAPAACVTTKPSGVWVNDIHSQLNRTWVSALRKPTSLEELRAAMRGNGPVCVSGGRHAMGGQQFASNATLLDMNGMTRILGIDRANGIVEVEAGVQWPALVTALKETPWAIRQKQTGADRLSIGGALAANVHGRGLQMKPFIGDVESFTLVDAGGELVECSRTKNPELFKLVIGGYGMFGVVASVKLRLSPRRKVQRIVEEQDTDTVIRAFDARIADGFTYGDFQFSIDAKSENFLRKGVFSCYKPVSDDTPMPAAQAELKPEDWMKLLFLAHTDKDQVYRQYVGYYLSTSGQVYWSDEHQLSFYPDDYHKAIDPLLNMPAGTEMITELYVPRAMLANFMLAASEELRRRKENVIYGTVRLIERDDESFLAWAKQPYACVIFNLHVEHGEAGQARAADSFRALIELAAKRDGSYYLTYHRWAKREQVERCYPQFAEFLREKKRFDPHGRFQSEWYRHYEAMFKS